MERKTNGLCVSGFVISLVSLVLCGGLLSLLSLILSIVGVVTVNKNGDNGKGLGVAGIIISAVTIVLSIIFWSIALFTGLLGTIGLSNYIDKSKEYSSKIDEKLEEAEDGDYVKDFGSYSVDDDWEEVDHGSNYYVYCYEDTFVPGEDIPNNIMVSHDTNPYAADDHMTFRDAILAQISAQAGESDELDTVNGSGRTTDNGLVVYVFDMNGDGGEKIQYYIVGDYEYVCVSAMIWDDDAAEDDDIREVAEDIVNSFEWN